MDTLLLPLALLQGAFTVGCVIAISVLYVRRMSLWSAVAVLWSYAGLAMLALQGLVEGRLHANMVEFWCAWLFLAIGNGGFLGVIWARSKVRDYQAEMLELRRRIEALEGGD